MRKTLIKVYKNDLAASRQTINGFNKEIAVYRYSKSNPEKFQETHWCGLLCRSIFFKKVGVPQPGALLKTRFQRRYFHVSFARFFKTAFYRVSSRQLPFEIVPIQFYVQ